MLTNTQITTAIDLLSQNQIVILPTDTIYGLSTIVSLENQQKINDLKKAAPDKPLIVLFSDFKQIEGFVTLNDQIVTYLKSPIPTTVIVSFLGNSKTKTVALRLVKRKDLKKIVDEVGPIFSTSVNYHGEKSLNTLKDLTNFNPKISVFFDQPAKTKPSRIYDSVTGQWVR